MGLMPAPSNTSSSCCMSNLQRSFRSSSLTIGYKAADKNTKLSLLPKRSDRERFNNSTRQKTLVLRYPANCHYYIALRSTYFREAIYTRMGYVYDCYILQLESLDNPFQPFQAMETLLLGNDSDKESMAGRSKNANWIPTFTTRY